MTGVVLGLLPFFASFFSFKFLHAGPLWLKLEWNGWNVEANLTVKQPAKAQLDCSHISKVLSSMPRLTVPWLSSKVLGCLQDSLYFCVTLSALWATLDVVKVPLFSGFAKTSELHWESLSDERVLESHVGQDANGLQRCLREDKDETST